MAGLIPAIYAFSDRR